MPANASAKDTGAAKPGGMGVAPAAGGGMGEMMKGMGKAPPKELYPSFSHGSLSRALNSFVGTKKLSTTAQVPPSVLAVRLAESIADLEYSIKTHEILKRRTVQWLKAHIVMSCAFYVLLIIHIWSSVYFGLTWFK